jgi:hypothetical protein
MTEEIELVHAERLLCSREEYEELVFEIQMRMKRNRDAQSEGYSEEDRCFPLVRVG